MLAEDFKPKYIFFPHYSQIIPPELHDNYTCVVFHMADLPCGRGGTPLQNHILRGVDHIPLCALKVNEVIDGGPVYTSRNLCLNGSAEEIYIRARNLVDEMIDDIVNNELEPQPQEGRVSYFKRRKPEQSNMTEVEGLESCYDFIRMLDAEGYPHAYLENRNLKFEFTRASLKKGYILADVKIKSIT